MSGERISRYAREMNMIILDSYQKGNTIYWLSEFKNLNDSVWQINLEVEQEWGEGIIERRMRF
jgi:uncharacterized protein YdeI (YjbR/CyaY-like superfamily)